VIQWQKQLPVAQKPQMECILDKRVGRKTRRKQYFEYLVKWKDHPVEDASWEDETVILKHGHTIQELMGRSMRAEQEHLQLAKPAHGAMNIQLDSAST
jgi:hypothetical protein